MKTQVVSLLAVVMFSASGCLVVDGRGGYGGGSGGQSMRPGDLTVTWSFAGRDCRQAPEVASVRVSVPGQRLANGGVFACESNGVPGIVLHDFAPGGYELVVEGLNNRGQAVYGAQSTFFIDGDVQARVDLVPVGGPNTYAYVGWSFPPNSLSSNPTCAQAGVSQVLVSIDGAAQVAYRCSDGDPSGPGAQTPFLEAGTHTIELTAATEGGYVLYGVRSTLVTSASGPVSSGYDLQWMVGGVAVRWSLTNGQIAQSCGQAGVTQVAVNFIDVQGNLVYGSQGDLQPCNASGVVYSYLRPGTYRVAIGARGAGNTVYQSSTQGPVVSVSAGVFVDMGSAVNVQLFRTQ